MADNFQMKMDGLKKEYAEMIMKASKDESLRLFLRFYDHFHFKITEAETRSLNQQMKIEELEAQLSEAEEIIVDLREQLKQATDQLEIARERNNSNKPINECAHESVKLDYETSYPVNEYIISDPKSITLHPNSDGVVVYKCGQAVARGTLSTESELNDYLVSKDGIASFVQPNRETYLFKNGCTERVRAIERKPFIKLSPPETVQTSDNFQSENRLEKSDNNSQCPVIGNKLTTNNPIHLEARLGYADQSLVNIQSAKSLDKADNRSQNPVIDNSHIYTDPIEWFKGNPQLKKADGNGNFGDRPSSAGSYESKKNEKTIQNGLEEQVAHESGSYKGQQESRSCRRTPGKNARYREAISVHRRSRREKPLTSWQKPLPCQQKVLSSGVNECVEVPIKVVDKMPKTEVCGTTKSDDNRRSSCRLKRVNNLVYGEQDNGAVARETSVPSDTRLVDSDLVDVPIIDGRCNPLCSDDNGKVLKFTFYRKRRKNVLTNIDGNIVLKM